MPIGKDYRLTIGSGREAQPPAEDREGATLADLSPEPAAVYEALKLIPGAEEIIKEIPGLGDFVDWLPTAYFSVCKKTGSAYYLDIWDADHFDGFTDMARCVADCRAWFSADGFTTWGSNQTKTGRVNCTSGWWLPPPRYASLLMITSPGRSLSRPMASTEALVEITAEPSMVGMSLPCATSCMSASKTAAEASAPRCMMGLAAVRIIAIFISRATAKSQLHSPRTAQRSCSSAAFATKRTGLQSPSTACRVRNAICDRSST